MKLKLRADYLDTLHKWRRHIEDKGSVGYDIWLEFFEPDNTMTFADLAIGQVFAFKIYPPPRGNVCVRLGARSYASNAHLLREDGWITSTTADSDDVVIPGKIIDGKFVPDEEGK